MTNAVQKICVVCGKNVSGLKRVKDTKGRYYCEPCFSTLRAKAAKAQEVAASATVATPQPQADPEAIAAPHSGENPASGYDEFELAPLSEPIKPAKPAASHAARSAVAASPVPANGPPCPCCEKKLAANAKICIDCGIYVPSGKPMITALGRDENLLYENAETIIRAIAWLVRIGLYPIASEAYATKKPIVTWVIALITVIASIWFFIGLNWGSDPRGTMQWMLWPPTHAVADAGPRPQDHQQPHDPRARDSHKPNQMASQNDEDDEQSLDPLDANDMLMHRGTFQWYQLVTNIFLHDPGSIFGFISHLGGNMLFLFIFGTRVNALIGNLKMAILYPLLGITASAAHLLFQTGRPLPALGASGAIMGLAGIYLIFFPVHRVYMAFWLRFFWHTWIKIWTVRGFWVLAFYLSFDLIATLLSSSDGVAHWAHLGGFGAGVAVALILLIARLQDANHGDLLSVLLGKLAWPLIGKPRRVQREELAAA